MSEYLIGCWNCKEQITLQARQENDGDCPNCGAELDLECYLESALEIHKGLLGERVILLQEIEDLKAELEEERQENASLRSGDDYERGAE
jgi:transcription initiation factor IIE alpha subunit